ncbi:DUF4142 domain-containing protein [Streptomyces lycii]|uniref:DUF4142 domain-containing protein n=1 Tax=Streptomyces lycii TaxID=2654337 RepID=A0ABQ7FNT2_9ACTN|nr:DUF4142 domain-containing protein [Streptomyces lycii]
MAVCSPGTERSAKTPRAAAAAGAKSHAGHSAGHRPGIPLNIPAPRHVFLRDADGPGARPSAASVTPHRPVRPGRSAPAAPVRRPGHRIRPSRPASAPPQQETSLRRINGTSLILLAIAATVGVLIFPIWAYEDRSGTGLANLEAETVSTDWGPLTATDRDFLVKVRLAGLWELPAGQQAIERAPTRAVRDAGDHLVVGHTDLDRRARDVGAKLGVELPNQPTSQQQGWLKELTAAEGTEYQRKFANILRVAHGKVFGLIAQVRHNTRNTLIRELADAANVTVLDHITMLEKTGMVDFDAIAAEEAGAATASPSGPPPPSSSVIPSPVPVQPGPGASVTSRPSAAPPAGDGGATGGGNADGGQPAGSAP